MGPERAPGAYALYLSLTLTRTHSVTHTQAAAIAEEHVGKLFIIQLKKGTKVLRTTTEWDLPATLSIVTPRGVKFCMPKVLEEGTSLYQKYMAINKTTLEDIIKAATIEDDVDALGANTLSIYGLHSEDDEE